jgi:heme A synthase
MTRWEPHKIMPPRTKEDWEKEFEEYKKYPEY